MNIAVVIPCRNEKVFIRKCVDAIYSAYLPDDCACFVYIIDGMSDDGTREEIESLKIEYPTLSLINNEKN